MSDASDFHELRVGDHISLLSGFPFSSERFDQQEGTRLIRIRDLLDSEDETYFRGAFDPKWLVRPRDILVGMDGDFNIVRWRGSEALLNQRILKADAKPNGSIDANFFFYWFGPLLQQIHNRTAATTVKHLSIRDVENAKGLFPKKSEQRRIAEILSTLDEAIEQTEALIAKHQQIKAGLMHDLFTRGVTPDGHLRPTHTQAPDLYKQSPLGWIPKEWAAELLRYFVPNVAYGISCSLDENPAGIPVLRMNNIMSGQFDISDVKFSRAAEARSLTLKDGDVLFNRTNSLEHVGKTSIWRGELPSASFASYLVRLDVDAQKMRPSFLAYWLNLPSTQIGIRRFATPGVHQVNINPTNLRRMMCAAPTNLLEQDAIANRIEQSAALIASEESKLAKLRQQKHGLMHDLLTGRVRVPERFHQEHAKATG